MDQGEKYVMKVSIIGGNGFLGTHLANRFEASNTDFDIVDLESPDDGRNSVYGDVTKYESLRNAVSGDVIVNLAAAHRDDIRPRSLYDDVNVRGAKNVCRVAAEKGINNIIFTSSVAVFGFAEPNTAESGEIRPFNDYGRTKWEAEEIYREWQQQARSERTLVIIRPTVVFGEGNRGNVFNLLQQINSGLFVMVGRGQNVKSMAYVENIAAFIEYSLSFSTGFHLYNYVDKPDLSVRELVDLARQTLGKRRTGKFYLPSFIAIMIGYLVDGISYLTGWTLPISSIRVRKFCSTTQFETSCMRTGFRPPVSLQDGLTRTIRYEFLEENTNRRIYLTE